MNKLLPILLALCLGFSACKNQSSNTPSDADFEAELQENINKAKDGDVIELPPGTFHIAHTLVINRAENITILGKGKDKTILDFQSKQDSMDGWKIISDGAVLQDFTIRNTSGNGIVSGSTRGVVLHDIKISRQSVNNRSGSSGIFLRECTQGLVEECEVSDFSNSGIELIFCEGIIARKNTLQQNTSGIEMVNCVGVDIIENHIAKNSIGLLITHTASSTKANTGRYRIFGNRVENNNLENNAATGALASDVPSGTGIFLLAANYADVYNNSIIGQKTTDIIILSGLALKGKTEDGYNGYSSGIGIRQNNLTEDSVTSTPNGAIGKLLTSSFGNKIPDIVFDGYLNPSYLNSDGTIKDERKICIQGNIGATFGNMDLPGNGAHRSSDIKKYDCSLPALSEVKLN